MSVEDTMRIIKEDHFRETMQEEHVIARNVGVLDEEPSLFLAGEQVTNFDDDVDDSPENDLALNNHLKMEMEMELPVTEMSSQSPNAKTRPTLVMKLRKIS
ncbi:hypothetical protein Tco_0806147 [Tanacetum coccineum]